MPESQPPPAPSPPAPLPDAEELKLASVEDFVPSSENVSVEHKAQPAGAPRAVVVTPAPPSAPDGKKANSPGFVISPFPPYKLIDARGMSAGTVVQDPDNGAIFRLPADFVEVQVEHATR